MQTWTSPWAVSHGYYLSRCLSMVHTRWLHQELAARQGSGVDQYMLGNLFLVAAGVAEDARPKPVVAYPRSLK